VVAAIAAGWGLSVLTSLVRPVRGRQLATAAIGLAFLGSAAVESNSFRSSLERFHANSAVAASLEGAVESAGGSKRVLAVGRPIVMNWSRRTAFAWQLGVSIPEVQVIWGPDWTGSLALPAFLFESPPTAGNRRAPLPRNLSLAPEGTSGPWRVYRAEPRG
jgi:hypothetical protein